MPVHPTVIRDRPRFGGSIPGEPLSLGANSWHVEGFRS